MHECSDLFSFSNELTKNLYSELQNYRKKSDALYCITFFSVTVQQKNTPTLRQSYSFSALLSSGVCSALSSALSACFFSNFSTAPANSSILVVRLVT